MVAANAVVLANSEVAEGSFVTGVPGKVKRPVTEAQVDEDDADGPEPGRQGKGVQGQRGLGHCVTGHCMTARFAA